MLTSGQSQNWHRCQFWLWPEVSIAYNDGFNAKSLRELLIVVENRRNEIERVWNEHFGSAR